MANNEIRTIVAPLRDGHVLLPNSAVAEILEYTRPQPFNQAPPWLLGELAWHGWQVPIICYEQLINDGDSTGVTSKTRILIIKTLGESTQLNYIGLVIQGLPRLKKVSADSLLGKSSASNTMSKISVPGLAAPTSAEMIIASK